MERSFSTRKTGFQRSLLAFLLCVMGFFPHPVLAADVTCKVKAETANLYEYPKQGASIVVVLAQGDSVIAQAQAKVQNRTWLRAKTQDDDKGWLDSTLVQGCNFSKLPVEKPPTSGNGNNNGSSGGSTRFVVSYAPAPNQGGPDGNSVLIPREVKADGNGVAIFRTFLIFKLDATAYMKENRPDDSIESVDFQIDGGESDPIYESHDDQAPFCLFVNKTGECENIWSFAQTNYRWPQKGSQALRPSNKPIDPNVIYRVTVHANYAQGSSDNWQFRFRIIPPNASPYLVYTVPVFDYNSPSGFNGEVRIQADTLAQTDAVAYFRNRLSFQLVVDNGSGQNGDGVGAVEFQIKDTETEAVLYQHLEKSKPYCVFSNQKGYCENVWRFADTKFKWPRSDPDSGIEPNQPVLTDHSYTAVMNVTDPDGNAVGEWSFEFQIVR